MNTRVIKPEQFEEAVIEALAQYGDHVTDILEVATKNAARGSAKELKASAPTGGSYARGWSHKAKKGGAYKLSETVYNRTDYQLTHLLEKPHATGGGGHYPKYVDYTGTMASIEEEYTNKFEEEVLAKI